MNLFRSLSIRNKLIAMVVTVTSCALLVGFGVVASRTIAQMQRNTETAVAVAADVVGDYSSADLAFDRAEESKQTLSRLANIHAIEFAALYDQSGTLFSTYVRGDLTADSYHAPAQLDPTTERQITEGDGTLVAYAPVQYEGRRFGTIMLHASTTPLRSEIRGYLLTLLILALGLLAVTVLLAGLAQRLITTPLLELTRVAKHLSERADYSVRVGVGSDDEIGVLRDGFNNMLQALERREREVRESTETLRALIDASPLAIVGVDRAGQIVLWNAQAEAMFGIDDHAALGATVAESLGPDWEKLQTLIQQARTAGEGVSGVELPSPATSAGHPGYVLVSTAPLHLSPAGQSDGAVAVVNDITARKLADARLREREEQLRATQRIEAVGRLAGGIAHDFNNLLTVVLTCTSLVRRNLDQEHTAVPHLNLVEEAARSGASLTRQLLSFSRYRVLQPTIVDINKIITDTRKMLQTLLGEDVALRHQLAPTVKPVRADAGQLEQIVLNLAINARDAMPTGGTIEISTEQLLVAPGKQSTVPLEPGEWAMLRVHDTGIGMDEQTRQRVFDPFFTTKEPSKGTGLGLSTVFGIVKQSNGHILVDSEPGSGTTFTVCLPSASEAAQEDAATPGQPAAHARSVQTILLVEDQAEVRALSQQVLEDAGYRVLAAACASEALALARNHDGAIALLLTDVVMPVTSGPSLARALAAERPDTGLLYMSGYVADALERHGVSGADVPILHKPFSPDTLLAKVCSILEQREPRSAKLSMVTGASEATARPRNSKPAQS